MQDRRAQQKREQQRRDQQRERQRREQQQRDLERLRCDQQEKMTSTLEAREEIWAAARAVRDLDVVRAPSKEAARAVARLADALKADGVAIDGVWWGGTALLAWAGHAYADRPDVPPQGGLPCRMMATGMWRPAQYWTEAATRAIEAERVRRVGADEASPLACAQASTGMDHPVERLGLAVLQHREHQRRYQKARATEAASLVAACAIETKARVTAAYAELPMWAARKLESHSALRHRWEQARAAATEAEAERVAAATATMAVVRTIVQTAIAVAVAEVRPRKARRKMRATHSQRRTAAAQAARRVDGDGGDGGAANDMR